MGREDQNIALIWQLAEFEYTKDLKIKDDHQFSLLVLLKRITKETNPEANLKSVSYSDGVDNFASENITGLKS